MQDETEGVKNTVKPARYTVPYHYQERPATHLRKLKAVGVVEKVNPAEPDNCILNNAISEKKTQGSIRMNIDARPYNKGAKHTRYLQDETEGDENYEAGTKKTDFLQAKTEVAKHKDETKGAEYQAKTNGGKNNQKQTQTDILQAKNDVVKYEAGTKQNDFIQGKTKGAKYEAKTKGGKNYKKQSKNNEKQTQTDICQAKKDIVKYEAGTKQNDFIQGETKGAEYQAVTKGRQELREANRQAPGRDWGHQEPQEAGEGKTIRGMEKRGMLLSPTSTDVLLSPTSTDDVYLDRPDTAKF